MYGTLCDSVAKYPACKCMLCDNCKPCGISVQPVYASVYKRLVLTAIVVHERICKRVVMVSGGGMGRHIKRLVYYDDIIVLVCYIKRQIYRCYIIRAFVFDNLDCD